MFNTNANVKMFALKPCCLPKMVYAKRHDVFRIGKHKFDAEDVCSNGSFNRKDWVGPPRWHLEPKFNLWADNLFKGIEVGGSALRDTCEETGKRVHVFSDDGIKVKDEIIIQVDGGESPIDEKLFYHNHGFVFICMHLIQASKIHTYLQKSNLSQVLLGTEIYYVNCLRIDRKKVQYGVPKSHLGETSSLIQ
jgi:hypothetical protein